MYIGFLTACMPKVSLDEKLEWASKNGFKSLEVACWPRLNDRDYSSSDIDVANLTQEEADEIIAKFKKYDMTISSLAYYDNNLSNDLEERAFINNHVMKCIDAAALLGIDRVGTFVGRNPDKSIADNFDEFEVVFTKILNYAESKGVRVMIENCPMEGWQIPGMPGTISFTPELWEEMFRRVQSKNFGLNYDPSHLHFQHIDYLTLIPKFIDRIFHVHAKDVEVYYDNFKYYGVFDRQLPKRPENDDGKGNWMFRMPSLGQVEWDELIALLRDNGYNDVISIEHEDPMYEGTDEKIKEGLVIAREYLEKFI